MAMRVLVELLIGHTVFAKTKIGGYLLFCENDRSDIKSGCDSLVDCVTIN